MGNLTPPFTVAQQQFLALCPKVTAVPSIIGSLYIIQHVLRSKKRRHRIYTRLMLGMSTMDLIYAVKCFVSTWPIPSYTGVYLAAGTTQTCTAAGFWGQGGSLSSAVYNGTLTLYYLLTIRYGWTQSMFVRGKNARASMSRIQATSRRQKTCGPWEWILHGLPLAIGWGTAVASLPLNLMNPIGWTCWIGPWPLGCEATGNCVRGHNAKLYRWLFFHAILWATFAFVTVAMLLIYQKIRHEEVQSEQYSLHNSIRQYSTRARESAEHPHHHHHGSNPQDNDSKSGELLLDTSAQNFNDEASQQHPNLSTNNNPSLSLKRQTQSSLHTESITRESLSRRFAGQALFYVLAFFIVWIFPMLQFAITNHPSGTLYYPLLAMTTLVNPFQGFLNALIYIRPRYLRYQRQQQQKRQKIRQRQTQNRKHHGHPSHPRRNQTNTNSGDESSRQGLFLGLSSQFRRLSQRFSHSHSRDNNSQQHQLAMESDAPPPSLFETGKTPGGKDNSDDVKQHELQEDQPAEERSLHSDYMDDHPDEKHDKDETTATATPSYSHSNSHTSGTSSNVNSNANSDSMWQAFISAISVDGDDDEDDWEAQALLANDEHENENSHNENNHETKSHVEEGGSGA